VLLPRRLSLLSWAYDFRLLFFATLGSGFGTYVAAIALTVDIYDRTGSGSWVAALLVVEFLPIIVIGLTLGPLVDRLSRRGLMIVSDLVRLAVFCALPFAPGPWAIVALAAVAGVATGFFRPAVYAGLPNLVPDEDLPMANSLLQTVENLAWMIGPVIGGVLLTVSGPDLAYWLNAATFALSIALLLRIPPARLRSQQPLTKGHWSDLAEGFALVRHSRALLTVLVVWNVVLLGNAAVNVAEVFLAKVALDSGDVGFGVLVGATGLGLTIGSLLASAALDRYGLRRLYAGSIAVMGLGFAAAAVSPTVWVAAAFVVVAAAGNGGALVCNVLLVQRGAPDRLRGRAFTLIMSSNYALLGLGMAIAGPLTDAIGPRWMWGVAGAIFLAGSLIAYTMARGLRADLVEAFAAGEAPAAERALTEPQAAAH
jgi:ENTS family enterobactin (siderophore) exporter